MGDIPLALLCIGGGMLAGVIIACIYLRLGFRTVFRFKPAPYIEGRRSRYRDNRGRFTGGII